MIPRRAPSRSDCIDEFSWIAAHHLQSHHCWLTIRKLLHVIASEDEQLQPNVLAFSAALKAGQSFACFPVQKLVQLKWIQMVGLAQESTVGNPNARIKVVPATYQMICCAGGRRCRRERVFRTENRWNRSIDPQGLKSKVSNMTVRTPHLFATWHEL